MRVNYIEIYKIHIKNCNYLLIIIFCLTIRFLKNYTLDPEELYIIVVNLGLWSEKINLTSVYPNLDETLEIVVASSNAVRNT